MLTDEDLQLRQHVLMLLLNKYGKTVKNQLMYQCADEWIAKGHKISHGVIPYFDAYFLPRNGDK
tara:strand:+ start:407 stop:598 length:192 start_codon:yes stop_codon:yes gene_type:complete